MLSTLDAESIDAEPIDDPRKDVFDLVHPVIQRVLEDSESATLAVGENLAETVATAEEFVEVLRASVGVMGSRGEGSISHRLDLQGAATDAYVGDLRAIITDNSLIAERVIETTGAVSSAAQAVSEIASAARVLCFNTKSEAGRLGDLGRPFMVIADQMRALSESIAESNDHISELTGPRVRCLAKSKAAPIRWRVGPTSSRRYSRGIVRASKACLAISKALPAVRWPREIAGSPTSSRDQEIRWWPFRSKT